MYVFLFPGAIKAETNVYSSLLINASAEPVPLSDMQSGWDGPFKPGRYAYADARWVLGLNVNGWLLEREQRIHYNLTFSESTSEFYNALERKHTAPAGPVRLNAQVFRGFGIRLGRTFHLPEISLTPSFTIYRISDYQFGDISGFSLESAQKNRQGASASLNYHFSDDKILDFSDDYEKGRAFALNLSGDIALSKNWQLAIQLQDVWNQFQFDQSLYTRACINIAASGNSASRECQSVSSASGRSGVESFSTSIPMTLSAQLTHNTWQTRALLYWHDHYLRAGVEKNWSIRSNQAGVSVHSTRQIGFHWRSEWHSVALLLDDRRLGYVRDGELLLGFRFSW